MTKYKYLTCKRTVTVKRHDKIPSCCRKSMTKVPKEICLQPSQPEHARPMEDEEPFDNGRGNIK